ncbi:MAG: TraM recognition domain-containing protein [Ferrovum sp.]|nr:TraM recognition domain-containing protein [Ferrovum sp.]
MNAKPGSKWRAFSAFAGIISLLPLVAYFLIPSLAARADLAIQHSIPLAGLWVACTAISWGFAIWWLRAGIQRVEKIAKKLTRASRIERNKKTDIRQIENFLPSDKKRFDPLKYVNPAKGVFLGLSEENNSIYITKGDWETDHLLTTGRTRSGKGVASQILGTQSIRLGELFVVLDPKCDNWMPHIFFNACKEAGKPYHFLDLRQSAHPQINLFDGCSEEVIENMFLAAFSLAEKGDNADFYRLGDRKAARQAAGFITKNPGVTPLQVLDNFREEWTENAAGFAAALAEMAELPSVNRRSGGIDIEALARTGGCLYVVGDMLNTRIIRMQRMLLMRLMLLAKNRDQLADHRIIRVLADEFRVHISRPFIVGLAAAAGWRLLVILAMQSFEDLRDCPADLDQDMVRGAVIENCALQLSYRIKDHNTAELLAMTTGEILVDDESRQIERNVALAETVSGMRSVRQADRYLVDVNMIKSLPVPDPDKKTIGCGVLVGASKLAQFCFTSPIQVERTRQAITPTTSQPAQSELQYSVEDKIAKIESLE